MLGRAMRIADLVLIGFVAYSALIAGVVVLLAYGREEIATAEILVAGGLALAAVHLWVWKRSGDRRKNRRTKVQKSEG